MNKNKKIVFFMITLIILLTTITAAAAANNTADQTISEKTTISHVDKTQTTSEPIIKNTTNTKKVNKQTNEKNTKTATKTVEVNNFDEFYSAMNSAVQDAENDEYVINFNEGTYKIPNAIALGNGSYNPNIIINGNNQQITADNTAMRLTFNNNCKITINNLNITFRITNTNSNITIKDSNIGNQINNNKIMIINNTVIPYISNNGDLTLDNIIINNNMGNELARSNITIINSVVNATITNNGNLTLENNIFGEKCSLSGNGNIETDDFSKIAPYLSIYNGNYTLENLVFSNAKTNNGNLTLNNVTSSFQFQNYGNLTLNNSNLSSIMNWGDTNILNSNVSTISTSSNLYISNSTFNQLYIQAGANITFGDNITLRDDAVIAIYSPLYNLNGNFENLIPYFDTYNGTYILENLNIINSKKNYGNLTIIDSSINSQINNNLGNLTIRNSTINARIANANGAVLIIGDDVTFGEKCDLMNNGELITNQTIAISPYLDTYDGNYTIENVTISKSKTNNGNLTIRNATINASITNYGVIIIEDDVTFGSQFVLRIIGSGEVITNQTTAIAPYLSAYNGDYTLENLTVTTSKSNTGILRLNNVTMTGSLTNRGDLFVKNSTMNNSITAYSGTLTFADDVVFGERFKLSGSVFTVVINDTTKISPYITKYMGDFILENATITRNARDNLGNITIRNSTISVKFTNTGNLTIDNSTFTGQIVNSGKTIINNSVLNNVIQNTGTIILGDNITIGTSFSITGAGTVISNDSKLFSYLTEFTGETTIELGNYYKSIINSGKLTIENSTLYETVTNKENGNLVFKNTTASKTIVNNGVLELNNATINTEIQNTGTLIISDDTVFGENFKITGNGKIIINDIQRVADYLNTYTGSIILDNKTINTPKVNEGRLTLNNCTINSTIENKGRIIIDDETVFGENAKITGTGEIVINDITRILPIIDTISGNYVINDVTLNKSYTFNGKVILNNCTTNNADNNNFGTLTLNNCTIDVGEDNIFLDNFGKVFVSKDTELVGKINDLGGETTYDGRAKTYVVNNRTLSTFFEVGTGKIASIVNPGDILDFQGVITPNSGISQLTIDKPVNITTTTNDGKIMGFTVINYTKGASGSNITGLTTYNTQFYVWNANHIVFDNISNIVENERIGWGVGQSSIRENSSYITVKNSYFYTKDNGGSSTLVLAWADYCTIDNNTIEGDGMVGNMLYLTTYNVKIPGDIDYNHHNNLINNKIRGPSVSANICYGICISGNYNIVDGNTINYTGNGIMYQWGSGVDGIEVDTSLFEIKENTVLNNKLYGGCGIRAGNIIYNNYVEDGEINSDNALVFNNTAKRLFVSGEKSVIYNNTIQGITTITQSTKDVLITNNTLNGDITIASSARNITITANNITGTITLDGFNNTITNNNITTDEEYTITSKRACKDNTITDNYLMAKTKGGDASVNLKDESNIIENNIPITTMITIIAQSEVTVNTTIPVTIMLTDMKGNLIPQQEVTITTDSNETITLKNGVAIYNYTPDSIGEKTITVTFDAKDDYLASVANATLMVTPDKDAIIEELTQNNTELGNKLDEANNKLDQLNNSNNNLSSQLETANNKIINLTQANNALSQQLADTNKKLDDLAKLVENLNKQLQENQKQINNLNQTIQDKDNQIKELTTKKNTKITVNKINTTKYGNDVTVTGTLTDASGAVLANMPVSVKINNAETKVVTNNKGTYTLTKATNTVGTNNVTVSFAATDKYNKASAKATFKVDKQTVKVTVNKINTAKFKDTVTITGTLTDANSKVLASTEVSLKINNKTVKVKTGKDGLFTYTTTASTMGTNNVTATYAGNAKYNKATGTASFKVDKQDLLLTVDRISSSVMYKDNIEISGKLVDGNGKAIGNTQVTIKVNSKTYKAKTDKNGVYVLKLRATEMDTNNVTVSYAGNTKYNKATAKTTFKVSKQDLIIGFNSVTYSNGKVTVSGTFTDRNRHALMNSLTKVTINGKTGNAKTDTNGTFTYTTSAKAGKIKLTLAYPGNARYNAYSKSTTLTIA
jgi:hypothetical protein